MQNGCPIPGCLSIVTESLHCKNTVDIMFISYFYLKKFFFRNSKKRLPEFYSRRDGQERSGRRFSHSLCYPLFKVFQSTRLLVQSQDVPPSSSVLLQLT